MRFCFDADRTKLPIRYKRRAAFRNSKIRMDVAGYANYERFWFLGWDITVQWGTLDPKREQWVYRRRQSAS